MPQSSSKERTATTLFNLLSGKLLTTSATVLWWWERKPEDKELRMNGCVDNKKSKEGGRRGSFEVAGGRHGVRNLSILRGLR